MHLAPELLAQITAELRADEGVRNLPYDDTTGNAPVLARWTGDRLVPSEGRITIGIGRNLTGRPLSEAAIRLLFEEDVALAVEGALRLFPAFESFSRNRQAAVINLIWNLGETSLRNFTNTTNAMRAGRWGDAASGLEHSLWFTQVQKSRRDRIVGQIRKG